MATFNVSIDTESKYSYNVKMVDTASEAAPSRELSVDELAAASNLLVDTVRYYQRLGLLAAPDKRGRRAIYFESHLSRLNEIRRLADSGFTLAQIGALSPSSSTRSDTSTDELRRLAEEAQDESLSRSEVAEQAGVPEGLVSLLCDNGLLIPINEGSDPRFAEDAVSMVRAGLAISAAGVPLDELVGLAADHGNHVDEIVERAINLFDMHVRPEKDSAGAEQALVDVVRALVPAVTRLVAQHFHQTLVSRAKTRGANSAGLAHALLVADSAHLEVEVHWR